YVGEEILDAEGKVASAAGTCENLYFDNFTIDVSKASHLVTTQHEAHTKTDTPYVGYLAGHITRSGTFTNVYVNRCTIDGASTLQGHTNNYGFYGYAEYDSLGGESGKGNNYSFTLNSEAVYSYFSSAYNSLGLANTSLVVRNTKEADDLPSSTTEGGDNIRTTGKTFGQAVTTSGTSYSLQGSIGEDAEKPSHASLSTIGYSTPKYTQEEQTFNAYYSQDGGTTRSTPSQEPSYYDYSLIDTNEGLVVNETTGTESGTPYYTFNDTEGAWYYGESFNRKVTADDKYPTEVTISLSSITTGYLAKSPYFLGQNTDSAPMNLTVYVDDAEIQPVSMTVERTRAWLGGYTFSFKPVTISLGTLAYGTHKIAIHAPFHWRTNKNDAYYSLYLGEYVSGTNGTTLTLMQQPFTVKGNSPTETVSFELSPTWANGNTKLNGDATDKYYFDTIAGTDTFSAFTPDYEAAYIDARSFETPIIFRKFQDGVEIDYAPSDQSSIRFNDFHWQSGRWWVESTFYVPIQGGNEIMEFVANTQQLLDSGYSYKNIDIVGGGVNFYYSNRFAIISVIQVASEKTAGTRIGTPPAKGAKFYATTHCPGSIVLFLKNTSNALDGRNDEMGSIAFTYVGGSGLAKLLTNVTPSFIRGDEFLPLNSSGESTTENPNIITEKISLTLKEEDVKKVAYCALDKEKKVLGRYTTNAEGNIETEMTSADQLAIDTYVLVLGSQSSDSNTAWITNVDFSYKAEEGYGGTFGSVEYRSTPDTVTETVFNFFLITPANCDYRVAVMYKEDEKKYYLYVDATVTVTINYFLYKPADVTYSLSINKGTDVTGNGS
ncbi:MAG: hypothetical protein ACI4UT_02660, partial [Candidatus Enteromonas sp.]